MSGRVLRMMLATAIVAVPGYAAEPAAWGRIATPADRARLRGWRSAWMLGLEQARTNGAATVAIAADRALFDPDRAVDTPMPPAGDYRCRLFKLGRQARGGPGFVAGDWARCRVGAAPSVTFQTLDGVQRHSGVLYPATDARAVLLGSLAVGDERRPLRYGRDRNRDLAGWVERIGERRWRIAFPLPAFESTIDIMELRPADQ